MQPDKIHIAAFVIITTAVILILAAFAVALTYLYQKNQFLYFQKITALKLNHEKNLMSAQLEMQESTFQHISREIHDNINLSLSLSKLQLNTINMFNESDAEKKINSTIDLISKSIHDLSHLSKTLNTDLIKSMGLINAIKEEMEKLELTGLFSIEMQVTGQPVFMDAEKELLIFRIVQESFNNIIKHSEAKNIKFWLRYYDCHVELTIKDNGKGFEVPLTENRIKGAGLNNITVRAKALNGKACIFSAPGKGTSLHISIPYQS
jgi:two-component system, NarL family, sensor kinase